MMKRRPLLGWAIALRGWMNITSADSSTLSKQGSEADSNREHESISREEGDGNGLRKDQALKIARPLSRERGDPQQVWAAWVLVGDTR